MTATTPDQPHANPPTTAAQAAHAGGSLRAAPSTERGSTNTAAAVLRALSGTPDATAAGLSAATGLGRSTITKTLAGLAERGEAIRTPGGRDGKHRLPDRWNRPEDPSADTAPSPQAAPGDAADSHSGDDDVDPTTEGSFSHAVAADGIEESTEGGSAAEEERGSRSSGAAEQAKTRTGARLGRGQVRAQIHAHLAAYPDEDFTPHEVGRVLDRSAGAVANALAKLTRSGDTTQTSDRPRRYRLAQAPQAAQ